MDRAVPLDEVMSKLAEHFAAVFERRIAPEGKRARSP
jgi:hypothetical protein